MTNDIKNQDRKYRPLVYVCSAYSGDVTTNTEKAKQYCRFALEQGQIPLAPHLMFPLFMNDDDPTERELAIFMDPWNGKARKRNPSRITILSENRHKKSTYLSIDALRK